MKGQLSYVIRLKRSLKPVNGFVQVKLHENLFLINEFFQNPSPLLEPYTPQTSLVGILLEGVLPLQYRLTPLTVKNPNIHRSSITGSLLPLR
jgi:hypothetical protein